MPPKTQEEINAEIARKRAEVMARIAKMNLPSAKSAAPQPRSVPNKTGASSTQDMIAAARARIEAQLKKQGLSKPTEMNKANEIHPMLRDDFTFKLSNKHKKPRLSTMPPVSSIKANQRKPEIAKLKVEHTVPEGYTDPSQNPYFDPSLGRNSHKPQTHRRRNKPFSFIRPGRYVEKAEKERAAAKMEQLKQEIASNAEQEKLEEEAMDLGGIRFAEPPEVEWWDAPFLQEPNYKSEFKITGPESLCSIYVQHPVPIEPPLAIRNQSQAPAQLILTRKERKKLRRQRRLEEQQEKRDKVMLGLLPPPPPKLKMSNFMRVMANDSTLDPTKMEAEVRRQMQARKDKHEADNQARKLTKEQRREKNEIKEKEEERKGMVRAAFRVDKLEHPRHWYKVSMNAQQMRLTGTALSCPAAKQALVIVEGSAKNIKAYKKLMLRRIDWTMSEMDLETDAQVSDDYSENQCHLIWQGDVDARQFTQFRQRTCPTESQAKSWLAKAGCDALWQLAKQYDPNDSITAIDPFI
ncbi:U4/U5/U6 small nuclear ribonucleoprotein prp3 [Coemansia sp. RSA 990]|nr:U4/U5/U6 small nuclear ribonucleoprotein prp3 [Coemansia sp. RSA 990]